MSNTQEGLMRLYLGEAAEHKELSQEEEQRLCPQVRKGERAARSRLTKHFLPLILEVLKEFLNQGREIDDLLGLANMALLSAVREHSTGKPFRAFALEKVRQSLERDMWENSVFVRDKASLDTLRNRALATIRAKRVASGNEPSIKELALSLGIMEWQIKFLLEARGRTINSEESLLESMEFGLMKPRVKDFVRMVESLQVKDRERQIFLARYGLDKSVLPRTIEKVAKMFGITVERAQEVVPQIWKEINPLYSPRSEPEQKVEENASIAPETSANIDVSPDTIIGFVADTYGLEPADLFKHNRQVKIAFARQVAMYILRTDLKWSFPKIADYLHRDHTTIMHGCKAVEESVKSDPKVRKLLEDIRSQYSLPAQEPKTPEPNLHPIPKMVLDLVSAKTEISLSQILGDSRREVPTRARHIAMYLLREDFVSWSFGRISEVFGKRDGSASFNAYNRIIGELASDPELRELVTSIRAGYTLSPYTSFENLEESQSKLFANQKAEAEQVVLGLRQKLTKFVGHLDSVTSSGRNREIFGKRYGFSDDQIRSLEEVGHSYGVTRERIRQITSSVWSKIKEVGVSEILCEQDLFQLLSQIRILEKLIRSS